jgi:hypothetical protein
MNIPAEFDEIRPYTPEELPAVYDELLADEGFRKVLAYLYPGVPVEAIAQQMHACTTNLAFQKTFCYKFLKQLVAKCATGLERFAALGGTLYFYFESPGYCTGFRTAFGAAHR